MTFVFADLSSHNTVTDWAAFLRSVDAGVVKATQGSSYVWSGAPAALTQFRAVGKPTGAYAFAGDLGSDGKVRCGDPTREADFFLANYGWRPGEVPILDFEPSIMPADPDGWCAAFLSRVDSRIGVVPWTYMSTSVAKSGPWTKTRATGSLLWAAQYGTNTGQPGALPTVGAWGSCVAWQYTSNGSRPGVASPPLDLSIFYGDAAAWRAHGTPGGDVPLTAADVQLLLNTPVTGADGKPYALRDFFVQTNSTSYQAAKDAAAASAQVAALQTQVTALVAAVNKLASTPVPVAQAAQVVDELGKRLTASGA